METREAVLVTYVKPLKVLNLGLGERVAKGQVPFQTNAIILFLLHFAVVALSISLC